MKTEIKQYLRDKNHSPIGVVIAKITETKNGKKIGVGWCKVHLGSKDRWDKEKGMMIAAARAECPVRPIDKIPHKLRPIYQRICDRAKRYFKDTEFLSEKDVEEQKEVTEIKENFIDKLKNLLYV